MQLYLTEFMNIIIIVFTTIIIVILFFLSETESVVNSASNKNMYNNISINYDSDSSETESSSNEAKKNNDVKLNTKINSITFRNLRKINNSKNKLKIKNPLKNIGLDSYNSYAVKLENKNKNIKRTSNRKKVTFLENVIEEREYYV